MDLLRYSDTTLEVCFKEKERREINDILRQIYNYPDRIRICPCVKNNQSSIWIRKTLEFLDAKYSNESSHQ